MVPRSPSRTTSARRGVPARSISSVVDSGGTTLSAPPRHSIQDFRIAYEEGRGLLGFRSACGFTTATWGLVCPTCGKRDLLEVALSGRGRIAAFSIQTVPSEEFLNDAPYAYLLVDLEDGGRLTGWMDGVASETELSIGTEVEWVASYKPGVHFRRRPVTEV